ncbi:MAG: chemotaxis protein CheA, partial [Betaproteobacteria bacterium]
MLDPTVENLLQELATEMAFLSPASPKGAAAIAKAFRQLEQVPAGVSPQAQRELSDSIDLCEQASVNPAGFDLKQIERLQLAFESISNAMYLAQPPAVAEPPPEPSPEPQSEADPEPQFVIGDGDDLELLNEFCNEGRDLLSQVEQGVLVLEESPRHKDTLNQVFRAFHTFKGGAGFLGIEPIQQLAHQLESLLDAARRDQLAITQTVIELILAGGDALQQYVSAISQQLAGQGRGQPIRVATGELLARVQACLAGEPDPGPGETRTQAPAPAPAPAPAVKAGPVQSPTEATPVRAEALVSYVKIDTRKLDALVDLMGELVIAQSMVVQHRLVQQQRDRELERHLRQLARITTDLQRNAMSLRMVPIRSAFQKMIRLVRDLATSQNKQVQLHLSGEDTELDRNIVEELADPLLHMMRNAVDHGIEAPAERIAKGKSPQGNIYLHAAHQGGGILIRMRDDGRGLDAQRILAKAVQKGLISGEETQSEKAIFNLIFLPGFSTAEAVTDISGRGVGMDVVRGNITRLRGRIDIESAPARGTTFVIILPLTLAIIDGMLEGVGPERFILPTV